jgi:hypothetical protein
LKVLERVLSVLDALLLPGEAGFAYLAAVELHGSDARAYYAAGECR